MRYKRRSTFAVIATGLAIGLAACGSDSSDDSGGSSTPAASSTAAAKPASAGKVAFIGVAPVTSGNWDPAGYQAFVKMAKKYNFEASNQESVGYDAAAAVLKRLARSNDIVIAHSSGYEAAVLEVAPDFPDTKFVIFSDLTAAKIPDNVAGWAVNWNEFGYLQGAAGCFAAKDKGGDTIGHVNSAPIPAFTRYAGGLKAGAEASGCKFLTRWTNSFSDVAKAKQAALSMIAGGAEVITSSADTADEGSRAGAVEKNKLFIANFVPGAEAAPENTLTSLKLGFDQAFDEMGKLGSEGKIEPKAYPLNVANDGIAFDPFTNVSDKVQTQTEEVVAKIKSGEIKVDPKAEIKP